ncbi:MAG: 2-hydroxyhepta-2,4-diene,7-dioate isomerase [Xanthobacteraceae bacterium]|jgi:2,4-diketo-3-deoxy-L-fuconate hydrolase|nr:2-hydroxyhepta-2,4-diene,7-dioate isomerase [Xanthobacteraceae bacterium]
MKLCRFDDYRIGIADGQDVYDVTEFVRAAVRIDILRPHYDLALLALPHLRKLSQADMRNFPRKPLGAVKLLSPILAPGKIIAAPTNYRAHVAEMDADTTLNSRRPPTDIETAGLFLKANTSLVGPSQGMERRFPARRTDYEVELVAVIGREGSRIDAAAALQFIAGYSIGLDMTTRGPEDRSFRKSSDSYSVLGPWMVTSDEISDPDSLQMSLHQNGVLKQQTSTADMVKDIAALVVYASSFFTLYPGDLLYTGTPSGVGPIEAGDTLRADIDGIGAMDILVRD